MIHPSMTADKCEMGEACGTFDGHEKAYNILDKRTENMGKRVLKLMLKR
jgi:hypothetical protein